MLNESQIFDALPDRFELVILPEDDPEMRLHNLDLLDRYGSEGKPVVFARIRSHQVDKPGPHKPNIFVSVVV